MKNCRLGVSQKKNISDEFCLQKKLSETSNCPRLAMLCRTKCDEGGTLQESLTLAKVLPIDVVDQHNGSHGCNGRCDAWCSGSRTSDCQSCIVAPSMRLANNWITGSSKVFDLSICLWSCLHFSSFPSFSRASTLGCVLFSFAKTLRLPCPLPFDLFLGLPLPFPCLLSSAELLCLSRWAAPGVV